MAQDDVANKVIEANTQKYAGIVSNARPGGHYTVQRERAPVPEAFSASGLNVKYTNRFDDPTYYTA